MVKGSFVVSVSTTAPIQFRQPIYSIQVAERDSSACESSHQNIATVTRTFSECPRAAMMSAARSSSLRLQPAAAVGAPPYRPTYGL